MLIHTLEEKGTISTPGEKQFKSNRNTRNGEKSYHLADVHIVTHGRVL